MFTLVNKDRRLELIWVDFYSIYSLDTKVRREARTGRRGRSTGFSPVKTSPLVVREPFKVRVGRVE